MRFWPAGIKYFEQHGWSVVAICRRIVQAGRLIVDFGLLDVLKWFYAKNWVFPAVPAAAYGQTFAIVFKQRTFKSRI